MSPRRDGGCKQRTPLKARPGSDAHIEAFNTQNPEAVECRRDAHPEPAAGVSRHRPEVPYRRPFHSDLVKLGDTV